MIIVSNKVRLWYLMIEQLNVGLCNLCSVYLVFFKLNGKEMPKIHQYLNI